MEGEIVAELLELGDLNLALMTTGAQHLTAITRRGSKHNGNRFNM